MTDTLIADAREFLTELGANNTRDWFLAHKKTYETRLRDPAKALLAALEPKLQDLTGYPATSKLFRINRDVRFSRDKTPYNTHLHMMWTINAGARQDPAMFFGIGLDYISVGAGMMEFSKEVLADWRKMVDLDGDRIAAIIGDAEARGYATSSWVPALKRVPPPFAKDHAHGEMLKLKGLTMSRELPAGAIPETALMTTFRDLWPFADMLIGLAEAPVA